jgi:hypothetical protein
MATRGVAFPSLFCSMSELLVPSDRLAANVDQTREKQEVISTKSKEEKKEKAIFFYYIFSSIISLLVVDDDIGRD